MIKGIGKQVVVLKNPESKIIEEAIFILKEKTDIKQKDLLRECENILKQNVNDKNQKNPIFRNVFFRYFLAVLTVLLSIFSIILIINVL